jgi:glycosyltransferase involved in cell wall biosynthesis
LIKKHPIPVLLIYYEPLASGQTSHVFSLAKSLDRTRFQVEVLIPEHLALAARQFNEANVKVTLLPIRKTFWKPKAIFHLIHAIRNQPDTIVHIHSQEAGLVARPLARIGGGKHILYTPQTIDISHKRIFKVYIILERLLALLTDRILSVNEADRRRMVSWGISPKKIVTVYNGVDLEEFRQNENPFKIRQTLGLRENGPLVMQIGRLSRQKSPLDFIEGAAIILQKRPEVQFVMIGDGPLYSTVLQRVQDLGLESRIKLVGPCDKAFRLIPAADIVTLTSLWEGAPYSLLEAMAWQKPVVTTAVNGCPEIVEDHQSGLLVPPSHPESWAQAVMEVLDNPMMAEAFGHAGRQRVEEKFTLPKMVRAVADLYEQTLV